VQGRIATVRRDVGDLCTFEARLLMPARACRAVSWRFWA